jgi:hypothetical protein
MFGAAGRVILTAGEAALPDQVFIVTEGNIGGNQWGYNLSPPMFDNNAGSVDTDVWAGAIPGTLQRVAADHDFSGFEIFLDGPGFARTEGEIYSIQNDDVNGGTPLIVGVGSSFLYNSFYGNRWQWAGASISAGWNGSGTQTVTIATSAP